MFKKLKVPNTFCPSQICERIHKFERRKLSRVSSDAEQIYFVGDTETVLSHSDVGDWPSGKAADSGSAIGGSNPSSPASINASTLVGAFLLPERYEPPIH